MKKKMGTPSRKAAQGARKTAPKALRLEVGHTYISRDGKHTAKITADTGHSLWPMDGHWIGALSFPGTACTSPKWTREGRIYLPDAEPEPGDLVREIPGAKRPVAKRRVPKSSSKKGSVQ